MFARVVRMQRALAALRRAEEPVAQIALACGYYDEAHLTNDLRVLANVSASLFAKS